MNTTGSPQPISLGEQEIIEWEFQRALGSAMIAYSKIEGFLFSWFERLTSMDPAIARRVFYSQNGTYAMMEMFRAALAPITLNPDAKPLLISITNKLVAYSNTRNLMAHGDAVFINDLNNEYHRKMIILQGRQWLAQASDDEILTIERLRNAEDNFALLSLVIIFSFNWDGKDPERSPDKLLQLLRLLPKVAHSQVLDRSIAKRFATSEQELLHLR